jgi:hypothetical protein
MSLAHKTRSGLKEGRRFTWDYIPSIHGIFILDEAKATHQLDLRNLARAMTAEMFFDILLGDWKENVTPGRAPFKRQLSVA